LGARLLVRRHEVEQWEIETMFFFSFKQKQALQKISSGFANPGRLHPGQSRKVRSFLRFQRAVAHQAAPSPFVQDFGQTSTFRASPMQAKSEAKISTSGDTSEKEANRVADQVTRVSETTSSDHQAFGISFPRGPVRGEKQDYLFPARSMVKPNGQNIPKPVEDVLPSPGQPLDSATRRFFRAPVRP
jgi:hypothetical protein